MRNKDLLMTILNYNDFKIYLSFILTLLFYISLVSQTTYINLNDLKS